MWIISAGFVVRPANVSGPAQDLRALGPDITARWRTAWIRGRTRCASALIRPRRALRETQTPRPRGRTRKKRFKRKTAPACPLTNGAVAALRAPNAAGGGYLAVHNVEKEFSNPPSGTRASASMVPRRALGLRP